jgi:hypothetical protein
MQKFVPSAVSKHRFDVSGIGLNNYLYEVLGMPPTKLIHTVHVGWPVFAEGKTGPDAGSLLFCHSPGMPGGDIAAVLAKAAAEFGEVAKGWWTVLKLWYFSPIPSGQFFTPLIWHLILLKGQLQQSLGNTPHEYDWHFHQTDASGRQKVRCDFCRRYSWFVPAVRYPGLDRGDPDHLVLLFLPRS